MSNELIIDVYKEKIQDSTEHTFLEGVKQAVLGWKDAPFVQEHIPKSHVAILFRNEELYREVIIQNMAINALRKEIMDSKPPFSLIKDDELKVELHDVKKKRNDLTNDFIDAAVARMKNIEKENPNFEVPNNTSSQNNKITNGKRPKLN